VNVTEWFAAAHPFNVVVPSEPLSVPEIEDDVAVAVSIPLITVTVANEAPVSEMATQAPSVPPTTVPPEKANWEDGTAVVLTFHDVEL